EPEPSLRLSLLLRDPCHGPWATAFARIARTGPAAHERPVDPTGRFFISGAGNGEATMIIVTRAGVTDAELDHIRERVEMLGMRTHISRGEQRTIVGCIGDETLLQEVSLLSLPGVESVTPILKPYKLASREFVGRSSTVRAGN